MWKRNSVIERDGGIEGEVGRWRERGGGLYVFISIKLSYLPLNPGGPGNVSGRVTGVFRLK